MTKVNCLHTKRYNQPTDKNLENRQQNRPLNAVLFRQIKNALITVHSQQRPKVLWHNPTSQKFFITLRTIRDQSCNKRRRQTSNVTSNYQCRKAVNSINVNPRQLLAILQYSKIYKSEAERAILHTLVAVHPAVPCTENHCVDDSDKLW